MTSGTTLSRRAPCCATGTWSRTSSDVDFSSARRRRVIVSVPPYHIAAVANLLTTSTAAAIVYLERFTAAGCWTRRREGITHAWWSDDARPIVTSWPRPAPLHSGCLLSYGAPRWPRPSCSGLSLMPGSARERLRLTETSSSIAVLGPAEHGAPPAATRPCGPAGLGRTPLPTWRSKSGTAAGRVCSRQTGQIYVRAQVRRVRETGQSPMTMVFPTATRLSRRARLPLRARRADDTIIRVARTWPAEIEASSTRCRRGRGGRGGLPARNGDSRSALHRARTRRLTGPQTCGRLSSQAALRQDPDTVCSERAPAHRTGKILRRKLSALSPARPPERAAGGAARQPRRPLLAGSSCRSPAMICDRTQILWAELPRQLPACGRHHWSASAAGGELIAPDTRPSLDEQETLV